MMENMAVDAKTLREQLSEILRDEHYSIAGLARSMNLDPETLAAWQREEFDGDSARVERIVGKFLSAREAFWTGIRQGSAHAAESLKATLLLGLTEMISRLVREARVSRESELIEAQAYVLLRDLELATKAAPACTEVNCWRCGADIFPPPTDIAGEIEKNVTVAEYSGWNAETFRLRGREKMVAGDRIVKFSIGAFIVRRPDKTQFVVRRFDD
jgi:transposase-like protein